MILLTILTRTVLTLALVAAVVILATVATERSLR